MAVRSGRLSELFTPDRVVVPLQAADKPGATAEPMRAHLSGSTAHYDQVLDAGCAKG
ncbi:MAG: hypothetical protein ACREOF_20860 [Gemmatimonadales bacterium]